jgi:protein-disulfide isomerase
MSSKNYRIILWVSVVSAIALVIAGMVWLASGGGQKPVYIPGVNEVVADDHVIGKADASVTLVEYADYECPACAKVHSIVSVLEENYGDRVRFVYRNFPIPGHVNGLPAAYAAEAAALQGKFSAMSDLIFSRQQEWSYLSAPGLNDALDNYAREIGLDVKRFDTDRASDAVKAKVDKDAKSGAKFGIDSTPTFFLNGTEIDSRTYDEFAAKLDAALKSKP